MSRVISFSDLKLAEELSHLNSIQMCHPSNDELMFSVLDQLGMDCQYAVEYLPSQHRNMQGKVVIDFQATGELQLQRSFVDSYLCSPIERNIAYGYTDLSLSEALASTSWTNPDYDAFHQEEMSEECELFMDQQQDTFDYEFVGKQIEQLRSIRDTLRGPPYNAAGSPKTREEFKTWYENQTFYEEKYL